MLHPKNISEIIADNNISVSDISRATQLTYPTVAKIRDFDTSVALKNYIKVSDYLMSRGFSDSDTEQTSS